MKIVCTMAVRDEADVIEQNIRHHLRQGVDSFIITDNGSIDGTREILQHYAATGLVHIIDEPVHDKTQFRWVTNMARQGAREGADWILNIDADEFWFPKDRRLIVRDVLTMAPPEVSKIRVNRDHLIGFPYYGAKNNWQYRLIWRNRETRNIRGNPLGAKIAHRADADVVIAQGNHAASGPLLGDVSAIEPLEILEVQVRSWRQFHRRVENAGSAYESSTHFGPNRGNAVRTEYELLQTGQLDQWYRQQCVDWPRLVSGLQAGTVVPDFRVLTRK